jgi:dephospho-CoA kinase
LKILLCGKAGAGKDTVANRLCTNHGFYRMAFGDEVKATAKRLFPEQFREGRKPRKLLQDVGSKMREISEDCWINYVMRQITGRGGNIVITDCRYRNELETAVVHGFMPVLVYTPERDRYSRLSMRDGEVDAATFAHKSETDLDSLDFTYVLSNSQCKGDLYKQVDELVRKLKEAETCK